ncbi:MAG TPA: hypothetical protein VM734_09805 [Kofleriaceae bacterium]|jgi:hypothetical protein|nr:hypothetical protein [Kofleriaceae bacterium]
MRNVIAALAVSVGLGLGASAGCTSDAPSTRVVDSKDAARLLIDRNWLDTWPQHHDDHLLVYRFVPSMGGGVYQDRTVFKGTFELFQFQPSGDSIAFSFPHTGEKVRAQYRIERVQGPKPFDLKLTITPDPRGPGVYYGMTSDKGQDVQTLFTGSSAK